jgi:hypothetical protein
MMATLPISKSAFMPFKLGLKPPVLSIGSTLLTGTAMLGLPA